MNVEQEDITADKSVDNAYSEDVLPEDKPKNKKAVDQLSKDLKVGSLKSGDDLNSDTDEKPENSKVKEKEIKAQNSMSSSFDKSQRIPPELPPSINESSSHKDSQQLDEPKQKAFAMFQEMLLSEN